MRQNKIIALILIMTFITLFASCTKKPETVLISGADLEYTVNAEKNIILLKAPNNLQLVVLNVLYYDKYGIVIDTKEIDVSHDLYRGKVYEISIFNLNFLLKTYDTAAIYSLSGTVIPDSALARRAL